MPMGMATATGPRRGARARERPTGMRMSRGMRRDPQQQRQQQQMITRWTRFLCVSGSSADIRLLIMCCCVCRWCSMRSSPSRTCSRPAQWCTGELLGSLGSRSRSGPRRNLIQSLGSSDATLLSATAQTVCTKSHG